MRFPPLFAALSLLGLNPAVLRADWLRVDDTIAWRQGGAIVWKFSFDPREGKPHFASLTAGGHELAVVHPADHIWHYGLWFSWKFINGVNYWEEDAATHRAEGATRWELTGLEMGADGSATIRLALNYSRSDGRIDLAEQRTLRISAPAADGSYAIDWLGHFVAFGSGAVLDRTPLPGEPEGKVYGGYAGLGLRLPSAPATMTVLTPSGPVAAFEEDRARPRAAAIACNFAAAGRDLGGIAVLNRSAGSPAASEIPWYVANAAEMRFVCAAFLTPGPLTLAPGAALDLRYRVVVRPTAWTPQALAAVAGE